MAGCFRGVSLFGRNNRRDETISPPGYGLDKSRGFGVFPQRLANLPNSAPGAVVCIQEDIIAPDSADDFIASDDLSRALEEQKKNFQRNPLQLQHTIAAAQSSRSKIKGEIFAKKNRLPQFNGLGAHGAPMGSCTVLHPTQND